MKQKNLLLLTALCLALSLVTGGPLDAGVARQEVPFEEIEWRTYADPHYGFTVDYPAHWHIQEWKLVEGDVGGVLRFANLSSEGAADREADGHLHHGGSLATVEIGIHLASRQAHVDLGEWAERYDTAYSAFPRHEMEIETVGSFEKSGSPRLQREGVSPLTAFAYTLVPRGDAVWFLWTNAGEEERAIYQRMAESFRFSSLTPMTLKGVYGESFQPQGVDGPEEAAISVLEEPSESHASLTEEVSADWKVPVRGIYDARCGSSAHNLKGSKRAIDISTPINATVYASQTGNEYYYAGGWDNSGYGLLLRTRDHSSSGYCAMYAHLNTIRFWNGGAPQNTPIALTGNSGGVAAHLHYALKENCNSDNTTNPISLYGMTGLSLPSDYYGSAWFNSPGVCGNTTLYSNSNTGPIPGYYKIKNRATQKYLDVAWYSHGYGAPHIAGQNIHVWDRNTFPNQRFYVSNRDSDGTYFIRPTHSWFCADVGHSGVGASVYQYPCYWHINQWFGLESAGGGYYRMRSRLNAGLCVAVESFGNGANVKYKVCDGTTWQQWYFEPNNASG